MLNVDCRELYQQSTFNNPQSTFIMFDALKNLGSLPGLMQKAREMQDKMKVMQDDLAQAGLGGLRRGAVIAIVNGRLEVVKIRIDKEKVDVNDTEMLEDLIVAAINAAQVKASEMMKEEMQKVAGEMGLPPGMMPG